MDDDVRRINLDPDVCKKMTDMANTAVATVMAGSLVRAMTGISEDRQLPTINAYADGKLSVGSVVLYDSGRTFVHDYDVIAVLDGYPWQAIDYSNALVNRWEPVSVWEN